MCHVLEYRQMTKLEEVMRAICCPSGCPMGDPRNCRASTCRGNARAAIAAMHEPSEEMLAAAEKALDAREDMAGIYRAMNDAALMEGE